MFIDDAHAARRRYKKDLDFIKLNIRCMTSERSRRWAWSRGRYQNRAALRLLGVH